MMANPSMRKITLRLGLRLTFSGNRSYATRPRSKAVSRDKAPLLRPLMAGLQRPVHTRLPDADRLGNRHGLPRALQSDVTQCCREDTPLASLS